MFPTLEALRRSSEPGWLRVSIRDRDQQIEVLEILTLSVDPPRKLAVSRDSGWASIVETGTDESYAVPFKGTEPVVQSILTMLHRSPSEVLDAMADFCDRVDLAESGFPQQQLIELAIRSGLSRARAQWTLPAVEWIRQLHLVDRYSLELNELVDSADALDVEQRLLIAGLIGRAPDSLAVIAPANPIWFDVD